MDLLLATRNAHKTREFAEILGDEFHVSDLSSVGNVPKIKETGRTFAENAILKALAVVQDRQLLVVADDSGLEVDALGGAPGIYSARYAGDNATDKDNVAKLLSELRRRNVPFHERSARFRCVIALARAGKLLGTFEGTAEGMIGDLARGVSGFGYDPIFRPAGFDKTFAELPAKTKNRISHRAKAIASLREHLARGPS
jgi:XTP/dITP diphosphohydrolase